MYSLLLAIIYIAFISLGLPDSLLGAGWPVMSSDFNVPLSYMGVITMIISAGTIISSLMSERLTKKLGTKYVTLISVFLTAISLFGFSTVSNFWILCLWALPYGLGAGAIDAALNNYVALHYASRHMSWLHCFWGVGTIISPYIMSFTLTKSNWNDGYQYVSYLQFAIVLIIALSLPLWKIHKKVDVSEESHEIIGLRGVLKIKGVPYVLIGFFAYCSAEATMMSWSSSYFVGVKNIPKSTAAAYASLFFIGMTAGRFINGFICDKFGDRNIIKAGTVISLAGLICVALPISVTGVAVVGFVIIGLGCAPIYPSIIHLTPSSFGKENSQAIIGIQMASAYLGTTFMPPIFGIVGQYISLKLLPFYCVVFIVTMIIMIEKSFKAVKLNQCKED